MAYAFVQAVSPSDPVTGTITATAGNLLIAIVHIFTGTGTITSISDTKSNKWYFIGRSGNASGLDETVEMWYAYNVAAGSTTITAVRSGTDNGRIKFLEFSGFGAFSPKLVSNTSSTAGGNPVKTTLTGTSVDSLIVGGFSTNSAPAPGSNYAEAYTGASNWFQYAVYDLAGGGGTVDVDLAAGSATWNGVACEFAPLPAISLYDLFPGNALDVKWTTHGSPTVTIANTDCKLNDQAGGFYATTAFNFTGKRLQMKIKDASQPDSFYFTVGSSGILAPMCQWFSGVWSAGASTFTFPAYRTNYGNYATSANSSRPWVALEHDGSNIRYYDSSDGLSWTLFHTQANAGSFASAQASFILDTNGGAAVDFIIDKIGIGPPNSSGRGRIRGYFK